MKRLLTSCLLLLLPLSAQASTDLAQQWGKEAGRLSSQTVDMMLAIDLGEDMTLTDQFALDVYRFGRTSADLAVWIDNSKGPNDLGCISAAWRRNQRSSCRRLKPAPRHSRSGRAFVVWPLCLRTPK